MVKTTGSREELVIVELIGRKKGNVLLIGGKEFEL